MQKIISLYQRNYDGDRLVRDEVVPGAEWVIAGEGTATRKLDGTCCKVAGRKLYKRYDLKPGKEAPWGFEMVEHDPVTGKSFGWVPVLHGPEDKWHRAAWEAEQPEGLPDGTYELCGPKVQGNPEKLGAHVLIAHNDEELVLSNVPRTYAEIKRYLSNTSIEGIVWHHDDGRMVKIKAKDFGIKR